MHIHPNQINPNLQQDALYAAEKAAAKEQAERTRRKLMEFASEISGEVASEDCIVNLGEKDEGQEPEGRQKQKHASRNKSKEHVESEEAEGFVSDWA
jgi:hypothetical protein